MARLTRPTNPMLLLFAVGCLFCTSLAAQKNSLKGVVIYTAEKQKLHYAIVALIDCKDSTLYKSVRTNHAGFFKNDNSVYTNLDSRTIVSRQSFVNESYLIADSVRAVKWKIDNELRKIAGFECRKAVGVIYDSVYVVAFYCPEIVPQGGPEFFNGLPGMILGIAIPRWHTTWFATKIELASIDESKIVPPTMKKGKIYSRKQAAEIISKKYLEAGWWKTADVNKAYKELTNYTF